MRILLLTSNSIQNIALSHMLAEAHLLVGIVYENRFSKGSRIFNYLKRSKYNPIIVGKKIYQKYKLRFLEDAVTRELHKQYGNYSSFYNTDRLEVKNINQKESVDFIKSHEFDIIIVSGTRMVKSEILALKPEYGIINMHTGLSPYYNGGPSCTFWCVYNDEVEYVGATVMFINKGIDSGNIILSDTVSLDLSDTYGSLEFKAIHTGNQLILKALEKLKKDKSFRGYAQEEIGEGHTYYTRDYTFDRRLKVQKKILDGSISKLVAAYRKREIIRIRD